jgi:hypothetical protein
MCWVKHDNDYYSDLMWKKDRRCKIKDLRPFDLFSSEGKNYMLVGEYKDVEGSIHILSLEGYPKLGNINDTDFWYDDTVEYIGDLVMLRPEEEEEEEEMSQEELLRAVESYKAGTLDWI